MAKTRRARIDAENDHRRVTRPRLRIFVKETRGYPTGYLRASFDTIQHGLESRKVGYGFSIILDGLWIRQQHSRLNRITTTSRVDRSPERAPFSSGGSCKYGSCPDSRPEYRYILRLTVSTLASQKHDKSDIFVTWKPENVTNRELVRVNR